MRSRSRTRTLFSTAIVVGALLLGGCATPAASPGSASIETVSVDTAFGAADIPAHPTSVVALEGAVGPLLAAGIVPTATADGDRADDFLPEEYEQVKDLPLVLGPDGWDYETIAAQDPDLIIGFVRSGKTETISAESRSEFERLSGIAPTVFLLAEGSAATKDATLEIAKIVGSGDAATAAKTEYEQKAADIKRDHADVLARYTFAPLDHYEGTVTVYTPVSWLGGILTDAGATLDPLSASVSDTNGVDISIEQLGRLSDRSVILTEQTVDGEPGIGAQELQSVPTYLELPAVREGHTSGVTYFFASRYETALDVLDQLDGILSTL